MHALAHFWNTIGFYVAPGVVGAFMLDAAKSAWKKQWARALSIVILLALVWGFGIGTRLVSWLAFIGVCALSVGGEYFFHHRKPRSSTAAVQTNPGAESGTPG